MELASDAIVMELMEKAVVWHCIDSAEMLNAQYASVFQDEGKSKPPDLGNSPYPSMPKIDVSIEGVKKLLLRLNPKKAVGPDMVPTRILRDYADDIAPILQSIFQQSLDTGMVPEDWKKANVTAVFKKGSRQVASNYRPVSLTCVSCKVLEHIVFRAIMDHVDFHKILVFFQHGFRSKHSCETQLVNTIEDLAKGLNDKQQLDLLILDFSKAFDLVAHKRLLSKLQYCGIHDQTLTWIKNWLTGHTQCVVVDGESSEDTSVRSGVPQGTVLGPLMFILYINDIGQHTSSTIRLFADDCLLYRVIHNACDALELQKDLEQMCSWAKNWHMRFNASKCTFLTITKKKTPIKSTYTIGGQALEQVDHHPYLGVELSKNLSWDHQINQTVSKAQKTLNLLRRNITECSQITKERAYKALVRPTLEYASSVWDPFQASHISKLEAVQLEAARFVTGQHSRQASVNALLQDLQWRSLQERRFVSRLALFHKALNGQAACDIPHYFPPHTPRTRCSHRAQFSLPHQHLDIYKYSFFPRTIRVWNIIPEAVAQAPDTVSFKTMLQQQLSSGAMHIVPPRGHYNRPRLGSTDCSSAVGAVY